VEEQGGKEGRLKFTALAPPWRFAFCSFHGALDAVAALIARDGPIFPLAEDHPAVRRILAWRHRAGGQAVPTGAAAAIVAQLLADLADRPRADPRAPARLVTAAEDLIARHGAGADCTTRRLAAELGISREYLSRAFASERGHGVREAITRARVQLACRLLREGDRAIADIARAAGFTSPARLAIVFQRQFGMSPRRWRNASGAALP
jgi:AraC-like DNA-binding protein